MDFLRFPDTPHLAWLGPGQPRDDKMLSPVEAVDFLAHDVVVEEKVDGANVGLFIDHDGSLRVQNRSTVLSRRECHPQFKPLFRWLDARREALRDALFPDLMLFGEWCYAVHSIRYTKLPDWFLAFDVYDRSRSQFWTTARRDDLVRRLGIELVPMLGQSRFDLEELQSLLGQSRLSCGPAEGLYVRQDAGDFLVARAKLVRPEFVQSIDEHWSRRALETNQLAGGATWV